MSNLKVFAITLSCGLEEAEKLGMSRHQRQIHAIVAAPTKKVAIEKFGITSSEARSFMSQTGNQASITKALSNPGQVFASSIDDYSDNKTYIEITRNPHVPFPRTKRPSFEDTMAARAQRKAERKAREFTQEERDYLVEMFEGANNPVAQSIAQKVKLMDESSST